MARVSGKVALISGGARGMGAAHAELLMQEGAKVVIGDILDDQGYALAAELGENVIYVHLDVTSTEDWERAVATAVEHFGGLDILVNNAAVAEFAAIEDTTMQIWDRTIAVNLTGTFRGIQAALPALKKSGSSSIINISSTAAFVGYENLSVYNASKWGEQVYRTVVSRGERIADGDAIGAVGRHHDRAYDPDLAGVGVVRHVELECSGPLERLGRTGTNPPGDATAAHQRVRGANCPAFESGLEGEAQIGDRYFGGGDSRVPAANTDGDGKRDGACTDQVAHSSASPSKEELYALHDRDAAITDEAKR